jgi:hypothetical protein
VGVVDRQADADIVCQERPWPIRDAERKPSQTPMSDPVSLMIKQPRTEAEVSQMKEVPFCEAIGSVLYLAVRTRPDIAVAVSILSKHVQEPRPGH